MMDEVFNSECLEEHNRLRSLHGCPPFELNRDLAMEAQAHAEKMASLGRIQHSLNPKHGENLSMRDGKLPTVITGKQATLRWYAEISNYHFNEERQSMSGHFSQIVWKSSKYVGFGRAIVKGGCGIYIVGYYAPPGNYTGQFLQNVPPPLDGVVYHPTREEMGW